jgi:hypothetical protein
MSREEGEALYYEQRARRGFRPDDIRANPVTREAAQWAADNGDKRAQQALAEADQQGDSR